MGVKQLRDAFNEVTGPAAVCVKALMDYTEGPDGAREHQALFFSGNFADGAPFVVQSDLVPPQGDLLAASREAARRLLQQKG